LKNKKQKEANKKD